jgi:hypothetical protein
MNRKSQSGPVALPLSADTGERDSSSLAAGLAGVRQVGAADMRGLSAFIGGPFFFALGITGTGTKTPHEPLDTRVPMRYSP